MNRSVRLCAALATLGGLLVAFPSGAQLSAGFAAASFQFNLSNPGARSLGMGGAFAGRADDATAAYANPAGLTTLIRPEVSFEGRSAKFRVPLLAAEPIVNGIFRRGTFDGEPREALSLTGVAEATPLGAPDATDSTISFLSFVYPHDRWTFALYRHQLADLEAAAGVSLGELETVAFEDTSQARRITTSGETRASARVDIASFGFAVARQVSNLLSVGFTVVRNEAALDARRRSAFTTRRAGFPDVPSSFDDSVHGDGADTTFNGGLLFRPSRRWAVGIAFREGPSFELEETSARGGFEESARSRASPPFRVPDVFSMGGSLQATRRLNLTAEWSRVRYSQLRRPATVPDSLDFGTGSRPELETLGSFSADDADELRAGLEFSLWRLAVVPTIRLGLWRDPGHKVRFEASPLCPGNATAEAGRFECAVVEESALGGLLPRVSDFEEQTFAATAAQALERLFPASRDRTHLTGGVGLVFRSRFQIDAAIDYVSGDRYVLSISGIIQF